MEEQQLGAGPGAARKRFSLRARLIIGALVAGAVVIAVALAAVLVLVGVESYRQLVFGPPVNGGYGFSVGTPYVRVAGRSMEVVELRVKPGGLLARAGVIDGDILVEPRLIGELYDRLHSPKGTRVTFRVIPGGSGPPLDQRPVRTVTVTSPGL